MPKKNSSWGVNQKAVEAREKKSEKKREQQSSKQKAQEDAYWKDDFKDEQRKKERKEKEQQKKLEASARKQDAKKLLEEEEAKLGGVSAKAKPAVKKVTLSEIDKIKNKERQHLEQQAAKRLLEEKNLSENPLMEDENPNRKMADMLAAEDAVEARSVGDALSVLGIGDSEMGDRHPEKRMKAAYNEFESRELPRLKAENPNLRLSQLKQMLRKEWQKSPDNPMNQR